MPNQGQGRHSGLSAKLARAVVARNGRLPARHGVDGARVALAQLFLFLSHFPQPHPRRGFGAEPIVAPRAVLPRGGFLLFLVKTDVFLPTFAAISHKNKHHDTDRTHHPHGSPARQGHGNSKKIGKGLGRLRRPSARHGRVASLLRQRRLAHRLRGRRSQTAAQGPQARRAERRCRLRPAGGLPMPERPDPHHRIKLTTH